ncbi:hypothetical protein AcW1_003729 [Taiwanofungus camphoratus]|nr:hypothetical protein AcW1_003729 [Antrodia cinnamomea]
METSTSLPIPRLRLTRHSPQSKPVAGPSRHSPEMNFHENSEDDEDAESTPRLSSAAIVPNQQESSSPAQPALPNDTPAARLRALLARVPNTSSAPHTSSSRAPETPSPSEPDSDLDPPYSTLATPSIARESLRELFSQALREPGNTPQKGRPRRNSIGVSEVDPSPRTERVKRERATNKGKRRSMSDEEADHLSTLSRRSEESFESSPAKTFDALRERLAKSRSMPPTPLSGEMVMDMSIPPTDTSEDTATLLRQLKAEQTPPHATSTPMRSLQISSQLQGQSNLLDGDSEMQKALGGMDSYEGESLSNGRSLSFPPARPTEHPISPGRPLSWTSHSKSHSVHNLPLVRHKSEEIDNSTSRASSSLSGADYGERQDETQRERLRERERRWNHPPSQAAGLTGNDRASPAHTLSRKISTTSLRSTDDGRSSRASSVTSRSEYRERVKELEGERNKEREREWNRPQSALSRSSSSLNLRERERTGSHPSRPDSAQSFLSPARQTLHRHSSLNSMSSSSRASSPASSVSSRQVEKEQELGVKHEIAQVRERNWNSPRPKWAQQSSHHGRPASPMPNALSTSSSQRHSPKGSTPPKSPGDRQRARQRTDSSASRKSAPLRGDANHISNSKDKTPPRAKSPLLRSNVENKATEHVSESQPPVSNAAAEPNSESAQTSGFRSRFGWSFPHNRTPLPPLELERDSPERSRPSSRLPVATNASHILVRSPRKANNASSATSHGDAAEYKKGHRRSLTEFSDAVGAIPRIIEPESEPDVTTSELASQDGSLFASDEDSPPATSTPTVRPLPLPAADAHFTPPASSVPKTSDSVNRVHQAFAKPDSPPPSPPEQDQVESHSVFSLQTPPRRPQYNVSKLEFKTPSPPKDLPELPEPPSFSEEAEADDRTPAGQGFNLTAMKTPRPPGAWMQTPVPHHVSSDPFTRAQSTPPESNEPSSGSGLVTPASTWPRVNPLPAQTPAPPGAWLQTPGSSARRKSILKVRFDVESETTLSDVTPDSLPVDPPKAQPQGISGNGSLVLPDPTSVQDVKPESHLEQPFSRNEVVERPSTPPSKPIRVSRRSPSVRVVDAFGRETVADEQVPEQPEQPVVQQRRRANSTEGGPSTPRSKSSVMIVDAMGRELKDVTEESNSEMDIPSSHNEALARIRQAIAHLAEDLSEVDRSCADIVLDEKRLSALEDASKAARSARNKISRSLQLVKTAEQDVKDKYKPLRENMKKSMSLPSTVVESRISWNPWRIWLFIGVQLVLFLFIYRLASVHAKSAFFATYYDPYNPDLYLHVSRPDTLHCSIPTSPWSISYVTSASQNTGWIGVTKEILNNITCILRKLQHQTWEVWGADYQGQPSLSWPPT